jgi:hypothetical protein
VYCFTQVGQAADALRRLRASVSSKRRKTSRRRRELCFLIAAEGCTDPHQASQNFSHRPRIHLYEKAPLPGTNMTNDKNPSLQQNRRNK